jgi:hypothetical protein
MDKCPHAHAKEKRYVGSTETYWYCPTCMTTWGGEEGPRKRALIAGAARADELMCTPEHEDLGIGTL